jgi:CRISPR type III-B/RAMP module-associated protein Cmr3
MPAYLIEPTDVLFFRDGIPMSAGQGRGAGCRLPFPSTLHEALRASLFAKHGRKEAESAFRPKDAPRKGGWLGKGKSVTSTGSKEYQSLSVTGPLPWHKDHRLLLPVPLDVALSPDKSRLQRLALLPQGETVDTGSFIPAYVPAATSPPDKHGHLHGWWTIPQYLRYLNGTTEAEKDTFKPVPTDALWQPEHRIGLEIAPARSAAAEGKLFAGSYLRMDNDVRICFQADLRDQKAALNGEGNALAALDWMLLGGDRRLARLHTSEEDPFAELRQPTALPAGEDSPTILKWSLVTPAIFAHGSLPGWCRDTKKDRAGGPLPVGQVCLDLPGKAALVSWCLGRPQPVTGWDTLLDQAKPTQLAASAGSVYYFLCENRATAAELAKKLHWQPRSDHYGEKGCGYGLVSHDAQLHPTSPDIRELADSLFKA